MNANELQDVLNKHAMWLQDNSSGERANLDGADLRRANLIGADLRWADLRRADLRWADLRWANLGWADLRWANLGEANLIGADLGEANLIGADLRRANLGEANLRRADLKRANLGEADLRRADLRGTCLHSASPWEYCKPFPRRTIDGRTLVLGSRTQNQPYMGGGLYELGRHYVAPVFSSCTYSSCHPGLYIAGGPNTSKMLVAFWLDEGVYAGDKLRVRQFWTLRSREDFDALTPQAEELT